MQVKKHQLEPGMEQLTGSKLGKEYNKSAYLTYMQRTSCVMPGWMNHKQESKFPREKATASDMQIVLVQSLSHVRLFVTSGTAAHQSSVLYYLPEIAQIHVHWVGDAI